MDWPQPTACPSYCFSLSHTVDCWCEIGPQTPEDVNCYTRKQGHSTAPPPRMLVQKLWDSRGPGNVVVLTTNFTNTTLKAWFLGTNPGVMKGKRTVYQSSANPLPSDLYTLAYREWGGRCVCLKTGVWWHLENWFSSYTLHHHLKSSHSLVI